MRGQRSKGGNVKPKLCALSDRELLWRYVKSTDETAFTALYERHQPMVFVVCKRVLHHRHDTEGAVQETFLVLSQIAVKFDISKPFGSWLHGIAYRVARTFLRGRQRRRRVPENPAQPTQPTQPTQPAQPIDESEIREEQAIVNEELQRLPEEYRLPLLLHYFEGKSRREIAQKLGWSEGTVATRLKKGCQLLRQQLECRGVTPT